MIALLVFDVALYHTIYAKQANGDDSALYFLDVGQGDSQLITLPGDAQILIDGGPPNGKVLEALAKALTPGDRYIDIVVMTHPQLDHFGGLIDVLDRYEVGVVLGSGRQGEISAYKDFDRIRNEHKVPYIEMRKGDKIRYVDATFDVLSPDTTFLKSKELNDTCVVLLFKQGGARALYTCDIGFAVENALVKAGDIRADILKVGHHGSRFSSTADFLKAVSPKVAVIEVGKNSYGHPTPTALERLKKASAQIFRTDINGTVRISLDRGNLLVYQENESN
jgi:competence protein ComEC